MPVLPSAQRADLVRTGSRHASLLDPLDRARWRGRSLGDPTGGCQLCRPAIDVVRGLGRCAHGGAVARGAVAKLLGRRSASPGASGPAAAADATGPAPAAVVSVEDNRRLVAQVVAEVINGSNLDAVEQLYAPDAQAAREWVAPSHQVMQR